jgi:predicted PolB exonuclease-like 3'-5' exonuclease
MAGGEITVVTWNGRGFDLPVLSMRSLKLGIPFGWYYSNRDMRYRYSDTGHLDLMDYLGDYGASRNAKLGDVARLIGLPGKVGEVSGKGVHDIYRSTVGSANLDVVAEKQRSVGRYCLQDTIQTALIFLRSRFHLGKIEREEYNLCLDTFTQSPVINEAIAIEWDRLRL